MPIDKSCVENVRDLLNSLPEKSLMELARTVTLQRIQFSSPAEAIKAIIDFSQSPRELLRRRRMTSDYIFAYLMRHYQVNATFKSTKSDLIEMTLECWHVGNDAVGSSASANNLNEDDESSDVRPEEAASSQPTESPEYRALAVAFLNWWYSLLKPLAGCPTSSDAKFGPQHFFADSTFHLYITAEDSQFNHEEHIHGAGPVFGRTTEIVSYLKMILNPNFTSPEAIKCFSDPYGLVFIGVIGNLFVSPSLQGGDNALAGRFEQSFGIVQDPVNDNNWVVKYTQLRLSVAPRFTPLFAKYFSLPIYELPGDNDRPALMEM